MRPAPFAAINLLLAATALGVPPLPSSVPSVPKRAAPDREALLKQSRAAEQFGRLLEANALPALPPGPVLKVLTLAVNDAGDLAATIAPTGAGPSSIAVTGWPGITTVSNEGGRSGGRLAHARFDQPGAVVESTEVLSTPFSLQIVREVETLEGVRSVTLLQAPAMADNPEAVISLRVSDTADPADGRTEPMTARSYVELRRKYPDKSRDLLRPIFADLGAAPLLDPDAKSSWQVFAPGAADDPAVQKKLAAVLAELDADDFKTRTLARQKLADLGQPAAVALMRRDKPLASAEQRAAVEAFLATYRPLPPAEVQRLRGDRTFLLEVFAGEDRTLSALALGQLRKITGKQLPFDEALEGEARAKAVARVRAEVGL